MAPSPIAKSVWCDRSDLPQIRRKDSRFPFGAINRVTLGVLSVPGLKNWHDLPGGWWVAVKLLPEALKDRKTDADAVVILGQNVLGQYLVRVVAEHHAYRAHQLAKDDIVKAGGMQPALDKCWPRIQFWKPSPNPPVRPNSGIGLQLFNLSTAASKEAVQTQWLSKPTSQGGWLRLVCAQTAIS